MQPVLQRNIAANKNEIHSDVAHFTTHGSNLSCKKSGCCKKAKLLQKVENSSICFCNKICTCCTSNWLLSNLFCSKWRKSRVWRDFRVIVSNQKSVFTQLLTLTRFVVRQVWTWVVKCPTYEANQAARFFVVRFTVALDRRLQEPIAEKWLDSTLVQEPRFFLKISLAFVAWQIQVAKNERAGCTLCHVLSSLFSATELFQSLVVSFI